MIRRILFSRKLTLLDLVTWFALANTLFAMGRWIAAIAVVVVGASVSVWLEHRFDK